MTNFINIIWFLILLLWLWFFEWCRVTQLWFWMKCKKIRRADLYCPFLWIFLKCIYLLFDCFTISFFFFDLHILICLSFGYNFVGGFWWIQWCWWSLQFSTFRQGGVSWRARSNWYPCSLKGELILPYVTLVFVLFCVKLLFI